MCVCVCVWPGERITQAAGLTGRLESLLIPPPSLLASHTCRKSRQPPGPPTNCNMPLHPVHGCTALGGILVPVSVSLSTRQDRHVWLSLKWGAVGEWPLTGRQHATFRPRLPHIDHILDACPCMPHWQGQAKLKRNKTDNAARGKGQGRGSRSSHFKN